MKKILLCLFIILSYNIHAKLPALEYDSVITTNQDPSSTSRSKKTWQIDASQNSIIIYLYTMDTTGQWKEYYKNETIYNEQGNEISYRLHRKTTEGDWYLSNEETQTYDSFGNMNSNESFTFHSTGEINDGSRKTYVYHENGIVLDYIYATWSTTDQQWRSYRREEGILDSSGRSIGSITHLWDSDSNDLLPTEKAIYEYGEQGTKRYEKYRWNESDNAFRPDYTYDYVYNDRGILVEKIIAGTSLYYSAPLGYIWYYRKEVYTYDANDVLLLDERFAKTNDEWIPETKKEYRHDQNGNTIWELHTEYDDNNLNWWVRYKSVAEYDAANRCVMALGFYDYSDDVRDSTIFEYDVQGNISKSMKYKYNNGTWILNEISSNGLIYDSRNRITVSSDTTNYLSDDLLHTYTVEYFYTDKVTSIADDITPMQKEGNSLLVAPTPTKDAAKVFATSDEDGDAVFTIYTVSANKVAVFKRAIEADEQTKLEFEIIERLPKGIYFVEMKVNGNVKAVTKLIKL